MNTQKQVLNKKKDNSQNIKQRKKFDKIWRKIIDTFPENIKVRLNRTN